MSRGRSIPHGVLINEEAHPPSTLAAKIVQNQTKQAPAQQKGGESATFAQLLHEILHNQATTQETDLRVNVQLINVIAEAGLGPLTQDNPFDAETILAQARDSIRVIEITIKRQPEVLTAAVSDDGPLLSLVLLSRLLAFSGRPKCETLPLIELLHSIINALQSSLDSWQFSHTIIQVLQECIEDTVSALEDSENTTFTLLLPPARSVAKLFPSAENAIALPQGCQTNVTSRANAFVIALQLSQLPYFPRAWQDELQQRLQDQALDLRPKLKVAAQWDVCVKQLLSCRNNTNILEAVILELPQAPPDYSLQKSLWRALIRCLQQYNTGTGSLVLAALQTFVDTASEVFEALEHDLRIAILAWFSRLLPEAQLPETVLQFKTETTAGDIMLVGEAELSLPDLQDIAIPCAAKIHAKPRTRKRRRLSQDISQIDPLERKKSVVADVRVVLGRSDLQDLNELPLAALNSYASLDETRQTSLWQLLPVAAELDRTAVARTVSGLIGLPEVQQSKKTRVLSIVALQEAVKGDCDVSLLDLAESSLGQLCLGSLHSSIRELRVSAGYCLPHFLRDDLPDKLRRENRRIALEYLRYLSDRDVANEQETLIGAWGQAATVCNPEELNLILLRLLEYLGHSNALICSLAFAELEKLSIVKQQSVEVLLTPCRAHVAVSAVQDLLRRPQKIQQLCDLLQTDVNDYLRRERTQLDTLPHLVLTKKKEIMQRIAQARSTEVMDICVTPRKNMIAILAALIMQTSPDLEEGVISSFAEVEPRFKGSSLVEMVKLDPTLLGSELLKHCGRTSSERKSRAWNAFYLFVSLAEDGRATNLRGSIKTSKILAAFFTSQILGIMSHFAETLDNQQGAQVTMQEKLDCLYGIEDMISLAGPRTALALPQIRAYLQSAMQQDGLAEAAISAWLCLFSVLDEHAIGQSLSQTFALIVQYWDRLSPDLQKRTHEKISALLEEHQQMIQEIVTTLPSLKGIPLLSKVAAGIETFQAHESIESYCRAFAQRLADENKVVVLLALKELVPFLALRQEAVHDAVIGEQRPEHVSSLIRSLLDATTRFAVSDNQVADLCGRALGIIGAVDPNRVDATKPRRRLLTLTNFQHAAEVIDWVSTFLEDVLVKAFKSAQNARSQGYLAYVIQELLRFCGFQQTHDLRPRDTDATNSSRWHQMPEHIQLALTPFLTSRYVLTTNTLAPTNRQYPGFSPDLSHSHWLRSIVFDLMCKARGDNPKMVFPLIARIVRNHDIAISNFLLPYVILNAILMGTVSEISSLTEEFLAILQCRPTNNSQLDTVKQCSESVFASLDYISTWLQEKKKSVGEARATAHRTGSSPNEIEEVRNMGQIAEAEKFLASIPPEAIAERAAECGSYARALFYWEQYIRQSRSIIPSAHLSDRDNGLFDRLQTIYANIDEPDGLEGIGAHLSILTEEQKVAQHTRAGRWTAAQAWYEIRVSDVPDDTRLSNALLNCLRETGQYATLLRHADSFSVRLPPDAAFEAKRNILSPALEAAWMIPDLLELHKRLGAVDFDWTQDFNVGIAKLLAADDAATFESLLDSMRRSVTHGMTASGTSSLQSCHEDLRKLHILYEVEELVRGTSDKADILTSISEKRLAALGSYTQDKQSLLGLRRAVMTERGDVYKDLQLGSLWLTTAKLARKAGNTHYAYNAVLQAYQCGSKGAKIEEARLLWHDGHQRQAIQTLEAAINSGVFEIVDNAVAMDSADASLLNTRSTRVSTAAANGDIATNGTTKYPKHNDLAAKAYLTLAKWIEVSGTSQTKQMTERYQFAAKNFARWEKGHYYLGKHYNKLLEAEKALPRNRQSPQLLSGEMTRLTIENMIRSIPFGNKYWHETIPKVLTLWLDLGMDTVKKSGDSQIWDRRVAALGQVNKQFAKYFDRIPSYVFYTALPQMVSRITHPQPDVWKVLSVILVKIMANHPSQALWTLLAVTKVKDPIRVERGVQLLNKLKDPKTKHRSDLSGSELRNMILQGQRLTEGLLEVCEMSLKDRRTELKLEADLHFNHQLAPSSLVVPIEKTLTANIPSGADSAKIRTHRAFASGLEKITIKKFEEKVLVLNSLQRPRKIVVRGSDGNRYGLLCKPKDDLRKDQRLMEFNGIINRALKSDAESSKRQLYIKTYAVTPLSEESGTIEWVENIKPLRDILLGIYARKGIRPNYGEIKNILEEAARGPEHAHVFTERIVPQFPASLHEWFTEIYTEPDTWFAARLRYARSAAVMSITGHALGLGDRHGENILLEEGTGGVFHVDFNCLFDKGLTFEKPELVPFRLTHNMVDAMGPYGYEGPFRRSSEITMGLLRQYKDTLMTVLETFVHDPTTDFVGKKKKNSTKGVPETPKEILESVDRKLLGLLKEETVPLSVEGYTDALIREAVSPFNLASMYIGWCSFL